MAKKIPLRQCVGCGEMKSKKEMMRVLKTPEDTIVLDKTGKKNGRGAYLCKSRECLVKAGKNAGADVREAAKLVMGGGGGQPGLATAGGKNVDGLADALAKLIESATK